MTNKKYLAVIDFEATCCDKNSFPRHEMEIIEIGLVIVDIDTLEIVDKFQSFVKPVRHKILTPFCKQLTTITQETIDKSDSFKIVNERLMKFLGNYGPTFCSWGFFDKKQLHQDCTYHQVKYPFNDKHINLKEEFAYLQGMNRAPGVGKALSMCKLKFEGTPHRGIDDAINIAKLLPFCLE